MYYHSWAKESVQWVKCLPPKPGELHWIPSTRVKKLGAVVHICNPRAKEVETGEFLGLTVLANQPTTIGKLGAQ